MTWVRYIHHKSAVTTVREGRNGNYCPEPGLGNKDREKRASYTETTMGQYFLVRLEQAWLVSCLL